MIEKVDFFSERQICEFAGNAFTGVISIAEPGRYSRVDDERWADVLRLNFHDIDFVALDIEPGSTRHVAFDVDDALEIIEWLKTWENRIKAVYVHCAMGISRSAAVAMFIAEIYELPFDYPRAGMYNRYVYQVLRDAWMYDE